MAEILSFHAAQRRRAESDAANAADAATVVDRAEALAYLERMSAFQLEMQRLSARYGVLDRAASATVIRHPAVRSA